MKEAPNMIDRKQLMAHLPQNAICAEVGVAKGKFSWEILEKNKPKKLFLIDSWEYYDIGYDDANMVSQDQHNHRYQKILKGFGNIETVEIVRKFSTDALSAFPDNFLDWIYIDADHSFEGCYTDLVTAHPKIKDNGYICGHDYLVDSSTHPDFGVNEAVHKFIEEFGYELIFVTCESQFRSYVLCKSVIAKNTFVNSIKTIIT
jgi:hypothetical protein